MGQKINPVSLRLNTTNRHFDSCWYSNYFYTPLITKDLFLRNYLNNFLKGIKLPEGRYSIQHLQKETQIYNFFCSSKPTREWRANSFGFPKRKLRFFFKKRIQSRKNSQKLKQFAQLSGRKGPRLKQFAQFYSSLNQRAIHKIQKRITSFQNFQLWSKLFQIAPKISQIDLKKNRFFQLGDQNFIHSTRLNKLNPFSLLEKKRKANSRDSQSKIFKISSLSTKRLNEFNLQFLQNLFIYKTLKLNSKTSKWKSTDFFQSNLKSLAKGERFNKKTIGILTHPKMKPVDFKYKNYLESFLSSFYGLNLDLTQFKIKNDWQLASYLADEIVYFLEKRIAFRRLKGKLLKQFLKIPAIRGVRITCSGRVGGKSKKAQRAKVECFKYGQTSLQVLSSPIDFCSKTAFTSFGSVGVKVWICYN